MWLETFTQRRTRRGTTSIFQVRCEKQMRGCASRVPRSPGAAARRTRGVLVVGATPIFWLLMRHGAGAGYSGLYSSLAPALGGRSHDRDPCGKATIQKSRTRGVLLNLALIAAGLRTWFSPRLPPSEVALLGLARPTDPFKHALFAGIHIDASTDYERRRPGVYNLSYGRKR